MKCATNIFVHLALKLYLHYLVEFAKFVSSVYNSKTMSEVSLPADMLITFMPQICHVSIGVLAGMLARPGVSRPKA